MIFQNCNSFEPGQPKNSGCQVEDSSLPLRGPSFGQHGGGVYAVDWTTEAVRVWSFSRDQIPSDITYGNPQPEGWGKPVFMLKGHCVTADNFRDQRLVRFPRLHKESIQAYRHAGFQYKFLWYLGGWSVAHVILVCGEIRQSLTNFLTFNSNTGGVSCQEFVARNPTAFKEAYWSINHVRIYKSE